MAASYLAVISNAFRASLLSAAPTSALPQIEGPYGLRPEPEGEAAEGPQPCTVEAVCEAN
jgi:hypothetical protein